MEIKTIKKSIYYIIIKIIIYFIVPLLIFIVPLFLFYFYKPLYIFPNNLKLKYELYTDIKYNGNSKIYEYNEYLPYITLKYAHKVGEEYPFIGLAINLKKNKNFIDISKYNYIRIKINTTESCNMDIHILSFFDKYTRNEPLPNTSYITLIQEIPLWQHKEEYWLAIDDFKIPNWWYFYNNFSKHDKTIKKDLSKAEYIYLQSSEILPVNTMDTITITEISFHKKYKYLFILTGFIIIIYYLIIVVFHFVTNHYKGLYKKNYKIIVPYHDFNIDDYKGEDLKKIIIFIAKNYTDKNITIKKISVGTIVSQFKISILIKNNFKLTYPQYLNHIRIAEAKRLLKEIDRNVVDIAIAVGYKNVNHFNMIFKNYEGISPLKFRKDNNK